MSGTKNVILLHGYASSSQSSKARFFDKRFATLPDVHFHAFDFNPTPKDFEYMTVTGMINRLRQYVLDQQLKDVRLIGSSMGALVGIHYAHWFAGVERMLLLAPAVSFTGFREEKVPEWQATGSILEMHYDFGKELPLRYGMYLDGSSFAKPIHPSVPTLILHGVRDDVVPISLSRIYAQDYAGEVDLVEVDSDHRLQDKLDLIWDYVKLFLLK